jgi:hypothetical protein
VAENGENKREQKRPIHHMMPPDTEAKKRAEKAEKKTESGPEIIRPTLYPLAAAADLLALLMNTRTTCTIIR